MDTFLFFFYFPIPFFQSVLFFFLFHIFPFFFNFASVHCVYEYPYTSMQNPPFFSGGEKGEALPTAFSIFPFFAKYSILYAFIYACISFNESSVFIKTLKIDSHLWIPKSSRHFESLSHWAILALLELETL